MSEEQPHEVVAPVAEPRSAAAKPATSPPTRPALASKGSKTQYTKTAEAVLGEATEAFCTAYKELHQRHFHSIHEELAFLREDYVASRKARLLQREKIVRLSRALRQCRRQLEDAQEKLAQRGGIGDDDDDGDDGAVVQAVSRSASKSAGRVHGRPSSALWLYAAAAQATHRTRGPARTTQSAAASTRNNVASQPQSEPADVQVDAKQDSEKDNTEEEEKEDKKRLTTRHEVAAGTLPGREGRANHFNTVQLIHELRRNLARRDTALEELRLDHTALAHARDTLETRLQRAQEELRVMTQSRNALNNELAEQRNAIAALETRCRAAEQERQKSNEALAQLRVRHTTLELLQQQQPQEQQQKLGASYTTMPSYTNYGSNHTLPTSLPVSDEERRQQTSAMAALHERLAQVQRACDEACRQRDALHAQLQQANYNETMTHVLQSQNETLKQRIGEMGGEVHQLQQREKTLRVQVEREVAERLRSEHAQMRLQRAMERTVQHAELLQAEVNTLRGRLGLEQGRRLVHEAHQASANMKRCGTAEGREKEKEEEMLPDAAVLHSENKGYAALMQFNDALQERLRALEAELQRVQAQNSNRDGPSDEQLRAERRALAEDNAVLASGAAELLRCYEALKGRTKESHSARTSGVRERIRQAQCFVDASNESACDEEAAAEAKPRRRGHGRAMQTALQKSEQRVRQLQARLHEATQELREYELLLSHLDAQGAVTTWLRRNQAAVMGTRAAEAAAQRLTSFLHKGTPQTGERKAAESKASTSATPAQCDQLLDACLDLLELCGEDTTTSLYTLAAHNTAKDAPDSATPRDAELRAIREVVYVFMHDTRVKPSAQFDLVYDALCLPLACHSLNVRRGLMVLLASVLPPPLYAIFERVNLVVPTPVTPQAHHKTDASQRQQEEEVEGVASRDDEDEAVYVSTGFSAHDAARRRALVRLVHALLGDFDPTLLQPASQQQQYRSKGEQDEAGCAPLREEEVLAVWVADVAEAFPALHESPAWAALVAHGARDMALRARMLARLAELCAAFDTAKTGKVRFSELHATATRVLGSRAAADKLLAGAVPDAEGQLRYGQLVALLSRAS